MAEYQVIARKWRPQRFADLVGQEHVVRTLRNAIRQDRIAHAYLLVGPRGVGKTTTARIFAKALNCQSPQDGEPCCQCESCLAIAADRAIDVIEIDAASRNSVDAMRELSEDVRHLPVSGRYKIYIIDEVHMLSKQAWNALLKTVEEPPAHVKFIFATTEAHQVLPTIISRCQRFDLLPIPTNAIFERLHTIAEAEKVRISDAALAAIARAAEGGMRDAQSLLDQMIAFFSDGGGNEIDEARVLALFGLTNAGDLDKLAMAMLHDDRPGVVTMVEVLARSGRNLETLLEDLLALFRGVQLTALLPDPGKVLEADPQTVERYRRLGENLRPRTVEVLLETLAPVGRTLRDAVNKTVFLETILFRAMREAHAVRIDDLIARLQQLRTAGELKFVDQAPSLAAAPLMPEPVKLPETKSQFIDPEPVKESVKSEPPPVKPPEAPEPEPVKAAAAPETAAAELYRRLRELLRERGGQSAETLVRWDAAEPVDYVTGRLTLYIGDVAADRQKMAEELPMWQQAIQDLTGDWSAMVVLTPETEQAAELGNNAPAVLEVPPDPMPVNLVEVVPQPPEALEPAPIPVSTATMETLADHLEVVPETAANREAAPPEVIERPEPPEFEFDAAMEAELNAEADAEERDLSKRSLIGDPEAVAEAVERPMVRESLDLFGGRIVDLFG